MIEGPFFRAALGKGESPHPTLNNMLTSSMVLITYFFIHLFFLVFSSSLIFSAMRRPPTPV